MELKYTKQFQKKLENIFPDLEYRLRYEKGNFKSGFCVLRDEKVVIINKYYTTEGKINTLNDVTSEVTQLMKKYKIDHSVNFLRSQSGG